MKPHFPLKFTQVSSDVFAAYVNAGAVYYVKAGSLLSPLFCLFAPLGLSHIYESKPDGLNINKVSVKYVTLH